MFPFEYMLQFSNVGAASRYSVNLIFVRQKISDSSIQSVEARHAISVFQIKNQHPPSIQCYDCPLLPPRNWPLLGFTLGAAQVVHDLL